MTEDRADDPGKRLEALLAEHRDPAEEKIEGEGAGAFDPFAPVPTPAATDAAASPSEQDDAEDGEDGDSLPRAPLFDLLRTIEGDVGVDRIDRIWVFPPRRLDAGETAVVVVAAFHHTDTDRRRVYAAHYTAHDDATETRLALDEFGTAPTDRVGRLVEEVLERIKDGPAGAPRSHAIDGRDEHWNQVLHELAADHLDQARRNPRLRP